MSAKQQQNTVQQCNGGPSLCRPAINDVDGQHNNAMGFYAASDTVQSRCTDATTTATVPFNDQHSNDRSCIPGVPISSARNSNQCAHVHCTGYAHSSTTPTTVVLDNDTSRHAAVMGDCCNTGASRADGYNTNEGHSTEAHSTEAPAGILSNGPVGGSSSNSTDDDNDRSTDSSVDSRYASRPEEEQAHFMKVCSALQRYSVDCMPELCRIESHMHSLSADDLVLLGTPVEERVGSIRTAVHLNQEFLDLLIESSSDTEAASHPESIRDATHTDCRPACVGDGGSHPTSLLRPTPAINTTPNDVHTNAGTRGEIPTAAIITTTVHTSSGHSSTIDTDSTTANAQCSIATASTAANTSDDARADGTASVCSCGTAAPVGNSHDMHEPSSGQNAQRSPPTSTGHTRPPHQPLLRRTSQQNINKVRSTLRQFVRDWSDEGYGERVSAYGPLLSDLEQHCPAAQFRSKFNRFARVLCPGSGLGRLPYEVVSRGYSCHGNEFSYFMLLGSNFMLNNAAPRNTYKLQPYCLATSNRWKALDHLSVIAVPDVCVPEALGNLPSGQEFAMCAGEFVEVYGGQYQRWDAILTCFFIDTAKNIFLYIRTIADILLPGALWANIGPLLFHYAEVPGEISVELSWEEIRNGRVRLCALPCYSE
eukprot:Lankesteria_metandrocarpae@DN4545_c0_g1_i1.p1